MNRSKEAEEILEETGRIYSRYASGYDRQVTWLSLGVQQKLRQYAVHRLTLQRGQTVLDVACGTGLNFPAIQAAIGPEGRLIGYLAWGVKPHE